VNDDLDEVREKLAFRREACFDWIDDAVAELVSLHLVETDEIRARVDASILREQSQRTAVPFLRLAGGRDGRDRGGC
jgi:hypothetical protein